ncbi:MAG: hypothetical protein HYX73_04995 [Acidobacteria bacterium]|nr:hypothetical protein [Acidobacteriota bacterium]
MALTVPDQQIAHIRKFLQLPDDKIEVFLDALAKSDVHVVGEVDIYEGLKAEIEQAKQILELEDDWDGEGSPGYSADTFNRAISFLTMEAEGLWESWGIRLPVPRIGPGPEGSIDLHWKQPSWELLVNIPADANEMATFYGDNYGVQKIRGSLDPRNFNLGIATWLMI